MPRATSLILGACISAFMAFAAMAADDPVQQHNSNAVWFENWIGLSNATLKVAAPNGKITTVFAEQGTPVFELAGEDTQDGVYRYELTAATEEELEIVNEVNDGRGDDQNRTQYKPFYTTGHFIVSRGVIITPDETEEEG